MIGNPKPISKPQQSISRLNPMPGSNSWARGAEQEILAARNQELYSVLTPKPGSNSWAQSDEEVGLAKKRADEPVSALKSVPRGTYEDKPLPHLPEPPPPPYTPRLTPDKRHANKPMPTFPKAFPSHGFVTRLKKQAPIKPTSVSANPGHTKLHMKNRADSHPVISNLWLLHRDEKVFQCHEKDNGFVCAGKGSEKQCSKTSSLASLVSRSKATQISSAYSSKGKNQTQLPVSVVSSDTSSDSTSRSNLDHSNSGVKSVRQLTCKTDPTIQYLLEDRLTALALSNRHRNRRGILKGVGVRNSKRTSIYGDIRQVRFAATNETRRPLSQAKGMEIEGCMNNKQGDNKGEAKSPSPSHSHTEGSEEAIHYSESEYGEENTPNTHNSHPRSLSSLPALDPVHPQYHSGTQLRNRSHSPVAVMPMIEESETGTSPQLLPASPGIWWNADSRGNSFNSFTIPSSLTVPPLFAGQDRINAVPAPPASSFPGYEQLRPIPADLARLELNLHHHIDSRFSCLTRLFTDKTDRILDQLVRRLEAVEDKVEKGTKNLEGTATEVKEGNANLGQENKAILNELHMMRDCMRGLGLKVELMSGNFEENRCNDHYRRGTSSGSERQNPDQVQAVPRDSPRGLTAHESVGNNQQRQTQSSSHGSQGHGSKSQNPDHVQTVPKDPPWGLTTHESAGNNQQRQTQSSSHGSQGHGSKSSLGAGRVGSSNKNGSAQTEGVGGQPPDLKDHPAFTGAQNGHPLTFGETLSEESGSGVIAMVPLFQTPSFRDGGWYKQAYGQ